MIELNVFNTPTKVKIRASRGFEHHQLSKRQLSLIGGWLLQYKEPIAATVYYSDDRFAVVGEEEEIKFAEIDWLLKKPVTQEFIAREQLV